MPKKLTKMTDPARHRLWAELAEDSRLGSLRFGTLGWVPRKVERISGVQDKWAVCVLRPGSAGTFRETGAEVGRRVRGPGMFFVSPGVGHDYGPERPEDRWEEFYWIVEGARVNEWVGLGWWPRDAAFVPMAAERAREGWRLFREGASALERRDGRALDRAKLALERYLSEGPWRPEPGTEARRASSPVAGVVEAWRRDLGRDWSLRDCARTAGLSYTRFRARFAQEYGQGPHAHLLRLRLELARRWLRGTEEPVKAIAARCGFARVEVFIRAFARAHGATPGRWRRREAEAAREDEGVDKKLAPGGARGVRDGV